LIHANTSIPTTRGRVLSRGQAHHDVASRLRVVGRLRAFSAPFVSSRISGRSGKILKTLSFAAPSSRHTRASSRVSEVFLRKLNTRAGLAGPRSLALHHRWYYNGARL